MYNYDLVTGEPSLDGSPTIGPSELSEQEIVNNANMMFDLDPQSRYQQMQQQQMYYGYPQQQSYYGQPQQPYYQQQFINTPSGFSGYAGNPAAAYLQSRGVQPQQQPVYNRHASDYTYTVPGYNPLGAKMILPENAEEICNQLQMEMNDELEEDYMKRQRQQQEYYSSLGYNYYGMPYVQQQYNPAIVNKYTRKIEDMRDQATQRRVDLNKHLSKLCHNYLGDDVDDNDIDAIYDGYAVTVPGTHIEESREFQRLATAVPIDTSLPYRQHAEEVASEYKKYMNEDTTMTDFFSAVGQVRVDEMLEEEKHRRRDLSLISAPTNTYRELIRRKLQKDNPEAYPSQSFTLPRSNNSNIPFGESFPTLNESAKLLDDGTLEIHAPAWLGNKQYVIKNAEEDEYEKNRQQFVNSIYRDYGSGGGSPNG